MSNVMSKSTSVLFVCTGNICRSPTAEGIFRDRVERAGASDKFIIDSAGTGDWHVGNPPDPRSITTAMKRGVDISGLRARQLGREDYQKFDYIIALDETHHDHMQQHKPESASSRISLLMHHAEVRAWNDVPDPYYGDQEQFDIAYDLIEAGIDGLFATLNKRQA